MLPRLTTPRLVLRPAREADLDAFWRLLIDPRVRRYLCDDRELSRAEVKAMLAESMAQRPAGLGFWLLYERDEHVGCIGLHRVSRTIASYAPGLEGEIEPTIALAPARWGRGYATEALAAAIAYVFGTLGLERLVAVVDEPNHASQRLMERVGFEPAGTTASGPCHPLRTYRLMRADFDAGIARQRRI